MHSPIDTDKLERNTTFKATARISMIVTPFLFTGVVWVGLHWLDGRFDEQTDSLTRVVAQVADLPQLRQRLIVLETKEERSRADREEFEKQMLGRMDRMQDAIVNLSNTVAGLTATIKADHERKGEE